MFLATIIGSFLVFFILAAVKIRWNIYLGTGTRDMYVSGSVWCLHWYVWLDINSCAKQFKKISSVLHFNDLILHKLISS